MTVNIPETVRLSRRLDEAWIGGVCAGLAVQFGWPVLLVRTLAVAALGTSTIGIVFYFAFWLAIPPYSDRKSMALESARRAGMRQALNSPLPPTWNPANLAAATALALLEVGLVWLVQLYQFGIRSEYIFPVFIAVVGMTLIWWQADHAMSSNARETSGTKRLLFSLVAHWSTIFTILTGLLMLMFSIFLLFTLSFSVEPIQRNAMALVLVVGGMICSALPWVVRIRRELNQAVADKLVSEARADIAAHLHDSVLQTLALIQRSADDRKKVVALARRQERELRAYLYGEITTETTLSEALSHCAQDVEDRYGVEVESVNVGDIPLDNDLQSLVNACREALVNAAKHSGVKRIDIYTEVSDSLVSVFVRDRGAGFDLGHIESDRMGVKVSICERMNRIGGRAIIKTAVGEGTEVRLEIPR